MQNNNPKIIIGTQNVNLDSEYADWIADLIRRYRAAQVKAAVRVNGENFCSTGNLAVTLCKKKPRNVGAAA